MRELRRLVARYGANSNSFLTLYPGYEQFSSLRSRHEGAIAYLDSRYAWIGATEPLAHADDWPLLLRDFAEAAHRRGKCALCLPVAESTAKIARDLGFAAIKIGSEPIFQLEEYLPSADRISTAKRLKGKGAVVRELRPELLSVDKKDELDRMVTDWLSTRKLASLSFLIRVEPWSESRNKKYFVVELGEKALAFLGAVPIPARGGWYFVDLFRWRDSPAGSTELLMLESMRILRDQGAKLVSLGVAPLSELSLDDPTHPRLNRLLRLTYEHGNLFYDFKTLYQFKLKFSPSRSEGAYLIYFPDQLGPRQLIALADAFMGSRISRALWSGIERALARFDFDKWMRQYFVPELVIRSSAATLPRSLARCRLTFLLFWVNLGAYVLAWGKGETLAGFSSRHSFGMDTLSRFGWDTILFSTFLHWNGVHLGINLISLLVFCGGLEYLAGSSFLAVCYGAGALFSNLLTCLLVFRPIAWLYPSAQLQLESLRDVGASVGILAAMGGLAVFFRRGYWSLLAVGAGLVAYVASTRDFFAVNHLIAMGLGYLAAQLLLIPLSWASFRRSR